MQSFNRRMMIKAVGSSVVLGGLGATASAQDDDDDEEPEYGDWFDDVDNYEETEDLTDEDEDEDEDEVTVDVGAGDDGYQFDPPAIRIAQDTTVVWEWTGEGGEHNVVHVPEEEEEQEIPNATDADEPVFETEITDEEGFTFEHQFEDTGTYLYVCEPHRQQGMKGAVVVE
ncbi:halocyanin domain-containing protein [Haloarchaeobius amylolyticus]|uniref:Halocyanin domain-containing protein n=1 Tax=Haloarchaeobius amylolyticus TaxID=1198296 RepID=A0ABD6BMB9_9EURY